MRANVDCPNRVHVRCVQVERVARVLAQLVVDRAAPSPYTAATPEFEAGAAFAEMARSKLGGELGSVGRSKGWERSPAPPDATATWLGEQGGVLDQNVKKRFFDLVRDRITMLRNRLAQSTLSMEQVCQGVCNVHCGSQRCDCAGCFFLFPRRCCWCGAFRRASLRVVRRWFRSCGLVCPRCRVRCP